MAKAAAVEAVSALRVEYMALGDLMERRHPLNPKEHDLAAIVQSFDQFGYVTPGVIDERTGLFAEGHGRTEALADLKAQGKAAPKRIEVRSDDWYVPVYRGVAFDTDAQLVAFLVAANQLTVRGGWNDPKLLAALQLAGKQDAQLLAATGFSAADMRGLARAVNKQQLGEVRDDADPIVDADALQAKWRVQPGDLYRIGRHRLLCGDSTRSVDVARLMGGERAALLATDPPYNVGVAYGDSVDDDKLADAYRQFTQAWFGAWRAVSDVQIVTPGGNNLSAWLRWFDVYHVAPWTKSNAMTNGKVARWWCWEPILFFGDHILRGRSNDIFDYPIGQQSEVADHPCPKPLALWMDLLMNYSDEGALVVEAFSGSGTTHVAAEKTGRRCYGMEIEPKYCAVVLERLSHLGLTPELV